LHGIAERFETGCGGRVGRHHALATAGGFTHIHVSVRFTLRSAVWIAWSGSESDGDLGRLREPPDRLGFSLDSSAGWVRVQAGCGVFGGFGFFIGFSNAFTMLQDASIFSPPAVASAPRMSNDERTGGTSGPNTSVITRVKPKTKRPNLYRVLILNDDYTPMEFVVLVLEKFFQKDVEAATKIMLHVHHHGIGECGVFTYEIAETKVTQVMDFARKHQHPLQCVMEKK
jgi:ATP-dependent Clp protease adaptor protein ClpS